MFQIEEVILNDDGNRPVILNLPKKRFSPKEIENGLKGRMFLNKKKRKIAAVASNKMLYKGKVKAPETSEHSDFLVEINRQTGKARLIAVDFAELNVWMRDDENHVKSVTHADEEEEEAAANKSNTEVDFNKQFGSKRTKRMTEQKERMKKFVENVKEKLETTVADIELNVSSVMMPDEPADSLYRPPINRDASVPQDVYNLEQMVPERVLDTLEEEATRILDGDQSAEGLCPCVLKHVNHLKKTTSVNRLKKCKILLYVNYLINFIVQPVKNITRKYTPCPSSEQVSSHIMNTFTLPSKTGRQRPLSMKDKAVCFVMVLSMIALDYQIEVEPLCKDLRIGNKKGLEIGRVLAFSGSGKDRNVLVLKIPLPPPLSLGAKRKR